MRTVSLAVLILLLAGLSAFAQDEKAENLKDLGMDIDITEARNPFEYGSIEQEWRRKSGRFVLKPGTKLEMVLIKERSKIAIIGGKKYGEGDEVGPYILKTITLDYVDLAIGEETKRMYVDEPVQK